MMIRNREIRRRIAYVAATWLLVAIVFAAQQYIALLASGKSESWCAILRSTAAFNVIWAALTLLILAGISRCPPERGGYPKFLGIHLIAGIAAMLLHLGAYSAVEGLWSGRERVLRDLITRGWHIDLLIYWIIVGLAVGARVRRRVRDQAAVEAELKANLAAAQGAMLRAQLRPHFLFNTLNTIAALIPDEPRTAERMVARLGDLLRIALDDDRGPDVTFAQDLVAADAYLAIEKLRLGDRLQIERCYGPEVMAARVPDLLLQPLVENAITHGLSGLREGGAVRICARRESEALRIEISDNGIGRTEAQTGRGLGLRSARDRVRLFGGAAADLKIATSPGRGFSVTITLPWKVE